MGNGGNNNGNNNGQPTTTTTTTTTTNNNGQASTTTTTTTEEPKADIQPVGETLFNPSRGSTYLGNLNGYITQAPLCIFRDFEFDQNSLNAWASGRLSGVLTGEDSMDIIGLETSDKWMNFTIQ